MSARQLMEQLSVRSAVSEDTWLPEAVERDPSGRFWRYDEVLGRGAFKVVYKAFDEQEGMEVAWNKVNLVDTASRHTQRRRLFAEIETLKRLKHKNIMTFIDSWLDEKTDTINFITELFTDGSLSKFRQKHKHLELHVLKKWAMQILQGLVYLHGHDPPIMHRDLKCDNIFVNGVSGTLKIGDLGLATLWKGMTAPLSVLGTPEFMAPEFYDEKYDEKVDVYAFGMLLLELVTMQYPYSECTNAAQIYRKVSRGVYPAALQNLENEELREFIEDCISYDPHHRPAARQLLKHDFFKGFRQCPDKRQGEDVVTSPSQTSESEGEVDGQEGLARPPLRPFPAASPFSRCYAQNFSVQKCGSEDEEHEVLLQLNFDDKQGKRKAIQFPFNLEDDTPAKIVQEMLEEHSHLSLSIGAEEADYISTLIAQELPDSFKSISRSLSCPTLSGEAKAEAEELQGDVGVSEGGEAAADASQSWGLAAIPEEGVPGLVERSSLERKSISQELSTRFQISP
ncbi:unnamed protein product [Ostreobium quekettii]|uniref:non-specific serine/threonine protein kinase n=1 Tax=Ostreobium quekettii TaxID=121088 RepID=A0A8S1JD51_9CHLO|nr:unnamed protein product [Ostreobium quekettii]|eukprot:evm.model.scf_2530.1 EVM.evm.TU.scf_2530.1   scf_2530:2715-6268(+)